MDMTRKMVCGVLYCLFSSHTVADIDLVEASACKEMVKGGLRPIAQDRADRFQGKPDTDTIICRGGTDATRYSHTPWVDWSNYYATGDATTKKQGRKAKTKLGEHLGPNGRGIDGSLLDLEYQRIELIKFNLFDNYTYDTYLNGIGETDGSAVKVWKEMRLAKDHKHFLDVGGDDEQLCQGELIRHRTLTGICNDIKNPSMGSTGMEFSRNVQFEASFPRLGKTELSRNRHSDPENGQRIGLLKPDPQLISRKLFTRDQPPGNQCESNGGDLPADAQCDYLKAPFFNVLAAFWIQFMTHDWFSHTDEGRNRNQQVSVGCNSEAAKQAGCRPGDRMEPAIFMQADDPQTFSHAGKSHLKRAYKTTPNHVTAWWDASQIYGFDEKSQNRVVRDKNDPAKLALPNNYLPLLSPCPDTEPNCSVQPQWLGQEATAFADNWNIGMSFYHNLFAREHNTIVDRFRDRQGKTPEEDSGLRNPKQPKKVITYEDVTDEELFQIARLVVSAEIAKIHTIEWTTQLLYDDPLFRGMNSNWFGLFNLEEDRVSMILRRIFKQEENFFSRSSGYLANLFGRSSDTDKATTWYSVLASGSGIFGLGNKKEEGILYWKKDGWDLSNPEHVNGGVNHFGSPFNFPEEFPSVYRLHPLVPDLVEYREWQAPNRIKSKVPVINTVRGNATEQMHERGLENWALSMGRQRLGLLHLRNQPHFLQNLPMPHLDSPSGKLDIVALDLIRDRERGIPRFNEFRRQIGLRTLTSFDDFVDKRLPTTDPWLKHQEESVTRLREIYGTHICDETKIISQVQKNPDGTFINDCLGHPNGHRVDNIEDVDNVVGWLAEYTRPHGFAISETQFHVFIINASRRLFSDRFFTSSFRPEFYSKLGYEWLIHNGPLDECPYPPVKMTSGELACIELNQSNGHTIQVSPLKRVLLRNLPELKSELLHIVNAFDPWARDRGEYYSLEWAPRRDAKADPAFK